MFKDDVRLFTLITSTLAEDKEICDRWRGFKDVADSRHLANRVEPKVVDALVGAVREAYPGRTHRYYAMKAEMARPRQARVLGPQCAAARQAERVISWAEAERIVLDAYGGFAPRWRASPSASSTRPGSMHGARGEVAGRLRTRRCRRRILILMNYQGKARDVIGRPRTRPWCAPGAGGAARARCWRRRR